MTEQEFMPREEYVRKISRILRITQEQASALLVQWFNWWPER